MCILYRVTQQSSIMLQSSVKLDKVWLDEVETCRNTLQTKMSKNLTAHQKTLMYSACRTSCSKKGIFNKKATHEASFFPFSRLQNVSFPKVSSQYILEKQINRKFYQESEKNELRPFFTTMHFFAASDDLLGQFGNQGCKKISFLFFCFCLF